MIDSEELLVALCGPEDVEAFKEVKSTSMRLARVVKEVIAAELGGQIPASGKQFLTTSRGTWRLAARANSDNSTEAHAHRRAGARSVQVFGTLSDYRRGQGWMSIDELYACHGKAFDPQHLLGKVKERLAF
jgi:hypothetical protein